jgi:hypothetical protein
MSGFSVSNQSDRHLSTRETLLSAHCNVRELIILLNTVYFMSVKDAFSEKKLIKISVVLSAYSSD